MCFNEIRQQRLQCVMKASVVPLLLALTQVRALATAPDKNPFSGSNSGGVETPDNKNFGRNLLLAARKVICTITGRDDLCGGGSSGSAQIRKARPLGSSTFCTTLKDKVDLHGRWCHNHEAGDGPCEDSFTAYEDPDLGLVFAPCGMNKESGICNILTLEPHFELYLLEFCHESCLEGPGGDCVNEFTQCCDYDKKCQPCSEVLV